MRPENRGGVLRKLTISFAAAALALAVSACSSSEPLPRLPAVPPLESNQVAFQGIPFARFLPNDTAAMRALGRRLSEREESYYASLGRPLPPDINLLAISGGGDDGAFGAGLLVGWDETGTRPDFKLITGVSTGALIAPFVFVGDDRALTDLMTTVDQDDIYLKRPLVQGLTSDALSDSAPLATLIARYVDARMVTRIAQESQRGRALFVITTDLDAGVPVIWDIGAIAESGGPRAIDLIRKVLLASASIPGQFPPVMFDVSLDGTHYQEMHVDGGASVQTFLYPPGIRAISKERPITAYVIRNDRLSPEWHDVQRTTLSIANRAVSTLTTDSGLGDLYRVYALAERDGVRFQLAYIGDDFDEAHPAADFNHGFMVKLFDYGRAKARAGYSWLAGPPGF